MKTDTEYLRVLTRKLFHSGFNKALVDRKWPAFESAFCGFDPGRVAAFDESDVSRLRADAGIVRHRLKIRATIANAQHFVEMAARHGSWGAWLRSLDGLTYGERAARLQGHLTHCGPNTVFYFLHAAGEAGLEDKPANVR